MELQLWDIVTQSISNPQNKLSKAESLPQVTKLGEQ